MYKNTLFSNAEAILWENTMKRTMDGVREREKNPKANFGSYQFCAGLVSLVFVYHMDEEKSKFVVRKPKGKNGRRSYGSSKQTEELLLDDPFRWLSSNNFVMFAIIICRDTIIKIYFLWQKSFFHGCQLVAVNALSASLKRQQSPNVQKKKKKKKKKPTNIDYIQKLRITFVLISRVVDSDGEKLEWRKTAGGTRSCMKNSGRDNKRTKESEKDEQKNHVPSMPCERFLSVG